MIFYTLLFFVYTVNADDAGAHAAPGTDTFKDQYCTDPRTMKKHTAYSEWADAYSCTRHRCQPGGRNLAIYTVGCKHVEAPESAIECEEVVEDTNMQFPYCCTRLRCLVVVRGEVWTRVLGQPWETLPAAPWSHMYKMKKPPPADGTFLSKTAVGPVYELASDKEDNVRDNLRSGKKVTTAAPGCNHAETRASAPTPDIVIALSTDGKERKMKEGSRFVKRVHKATHTIPNPDDVMDHNELEALDIEDPIIATEKFPEMASDERFYAKAFDVTKKPSFKSQQSWTDIAQSASNINIDRKDTNFQQSDILSQITQDIDKKDEKPTNLQALVDAIGTRMRDIEDVVQKMSEKVHQKPVDPEVSSVEKRTYSSNDGTYKHNMADIIDGSKKKSNNDEQFKSQYLNTVTEGAKDQPFEDNRYFSDASNTVNRRSNPVNPPKEPPIETFMAPVDTRRKSQHGSAMTTSEEAEKKHKKRVHKKKKTKGHAHKKRRPKEDKRKRDKLDSVELDHVGTLEDTSAVGS